MREIIDSIRRGECNACVVIAAVLLTSLAYWLAVPWAGAFFLNDVVDGPLVVVSFVAGAYYLTWALFNCSLTVDRAWMLRFGICLAWIGNGVWRVSRLLYEKGILPGITGPHDALRGYMILIMAMAGVMHILAVDFDDGRPRMRPAVLAAGSVAAGIIGILLFRRFA